MIKSRLLFIFAAVAAAAMAFTSCSDGESYADQLNDERHATNHFLAHYRVVDHIPADTVFEVGTDAPFYKLDEDGNVYMQVLRYTKHSADSAKTSQNIYFRYYRYNLLTLYSSQEWSGSGNENDMSQDPSYFQYNNYTMPQSSSWGYGVQMPLKYLGVDSEVNIVVKSQYGKSDEISYVVPFLYHIRYFRSRV